MWKTQMKLPASAEGRAHPGSSINYVNAEGQILFPSSFACPPGLQLSRSSNSAHRLPGLTH